MKSPQMTERVRVTSADYNGRDWDGCPFSDTPEWLQTAVTVGDITPDGAESYCADYAVWKVRGAGEAWPGDHIVLTGPRQYAIESARGNPTATTGAAKP